MCLPLTLFRTPPVIPHLPLHLITHAIWYLRTLIVYVGIAMATDLIRISLAAIDMSRSSQLLHFLPILSHSGWNLSDFIRPSGVGNPKYFASKATVSVSKI